MKSNKDLGYQPLYGQPHKALGDERSWENDYSYIGSLTLHVTIGQRGSEYRVYGYLWHNEQDASREGKRGTCCGRAKSIEDAIASFRANAAAIRWHMLGVDKVLLEMRESLSCVANA